MMQVLLEVCDQVFQSLWYVLPYLAVAGAIFSVLSHFTPCNGERPWWRKRGLGVDLVYWIVVPVITRFGRLGFTVMFTVYLLGIRKVDDITRFYAEGHGFLASLPLWAQVVIYLVVSDLALYWIHRAFHDVSLWRFHAVHHAPVDLDWTSAARFHPVNLFLGTTLVDVFALVAGIKPEVFVFLMPFTTLTSAFVHADLDWTLGPLRYVFVSPVFHRWHHTLPNEGGNRNFASNFAIFDLLFGTFYMPAGKLPRVYGIVDADMPENVGLQLLYPLMR
ncbi:MAG: sterol desaturase family protein [Alphaproteobacteria bacterium]|nr:sterol desaturase family protein [Alphaproteobacteria bacterium]